MKLNSVMPSRPPLGRGVLAWRTAAPSLLVKDGGAEPPLGWMLLGAAGLGLVAGPVLGFFQARVLRVLGVRPWVWISGVAVAWALGMPRVFLAAGQPWSRAPMMVALLVLAGGVVGLVTGLVLVTEDRRASRGTAPSSRGAVRADPGFALGAGEPLRGPGGLAGPPPRHGAPPALRASFP